MDKKMKEKKEKDKVSARGRVTQKESGDRTALKVPDDTKFFQVKKEGSYRIEILPYVAGKGNPFAAEGQKHFERTYWVHRGIGADNASYCCLQKTFKKPCPICEHRAKLTKDNDADEDTIKNLAPKERQLFNVFDHANPDRGVQIWDNSFHLFGKFLDKKVRNADDGEYDLFADKEEGLTIKIGASEESGGGHTYYQCSDIEFKPRKTPLDDELYEQVYCLDDLPKEYEKEALKKLFLMIEDKKEQDDDEDDDEDDKKPAPKAGKKPAADDDDDDGEVTAKSKKMKIGSMVTHEDFGDCEITKISDDGTSVTVEDDDGKSHKNISPADLTLTEDDDEDDEDDAPPKKPAAGKAGKKPAEEEDDDEDDDDDDEDDDPPAKKPGKKPAAADDDDEDDDDDDDEDDDDDAPPKKPGKKPAEDDDDDDDDDDEEEDDDEDEDDDPPAKPGKKPGKK